MPLAVAADTTHGNQWRVLPLLLVGAAGRTHAHHESGWRVEIDPDIADPLEMAGEVPLHAKVAQQRVRKVRREQDQHFALADLRSNDLIGALPEMPARCLPHVSRSR